MLKFNLLKDSTWNKQQGQSVGRDLFSVIDLFIQPSPNAKGRNLWRIFFEKFSFKNLMDTK